MRPFILGVDIDGVVADFTPAIRFAASEWLGKDIALLDPAPDYEFTQWGINEAPGGYPALHKWAVDERGLFVHMVPVDGAPQALRRLSKAGVFIRLVTARICVKGANAEIVKQTVDWLDRHGVPYRDICFTKDKTAVMSALHIDDAPKHINALRGIGRKVLVFQSSVNTGTTGPGAGNWPEIEQLVLAEKAKFETENK